MGTPVLRHPLSIAVHSSSRVMNTSNTSGFTGAIWAKRPADASMRARQFAGCAFFLALPSGARTTRNDRSPDVCNPCNPMVTPDKLRLPRETLLRLRRLRLLPLLGSL